MNNKYVFQEQKALITFITGGDPDIETTEQLILAMAGAGANIIEIGVPFSDPVAEGPDIQAADERALKKGCTVDKLFDMAAGLRRKTDVPFFFVTYLNPIFTYGKENFVIRCQQSGITGLVVPDMPYEEKDELDVLCTRYGIDLVSMLVPSTPQRIAMIASASSGFIHCLPALGTGHNKGRDMAEMMGIIRKTADTPCVLDYGILSADPKTFLPLFDGVVVSEPIMKLIAIHGSNSVAPVAELLRAIKKDLGI